MTKRYKYIIATAERKIKNYVCFTNLQAVQAYVTFAFIALPIIQINTCY